MDEERRRILRALIDLAEENSPAACWDDSRALQLLRRQATADELRELGMSQRMIDYVFPDQHVG